MSRYTLGALTGLLAAALLLARAALAGDLPGYRDVDVEGLEALRARGAVLVDVRRADEWRGGGVIEGARLITGIDGRGRLVPGFPAEVARLAAGGAPIVLICRAGNRSAVLADLLSRNGVPEVYSVRGGMLAWKAAGKPVVPAP